MIDSIKDIWDFSQRTAVFNYNLFLPPEEIILNFIKATIHFWVNTLLFLIARTILNLDVLKMNPAVWTLVFKTCITANFVLNLQQNCESKHLNSTRVHRKKKRSCVAAWLLSAPLVTFSFFCVWHKHPQFGSDERAHLFQISHIDNINHSSLSVAVALLFPLMWRFGVDHRGVSRPDTVCKPEGSSQRQPAALTAM